MNVITKILSELAYMVWDIYWGLALGFILSSLIRAFVSTGSISSRLGKNSVASIGLSTLFGAISSSCSYAAASMARTLMIKGSTWSNAVSFMVASTNLVFEIFIVIVSLFADFLNYQINAETSDFIRKLCVLQKVYETDDSF